MRARIFHRVPLSRLLIISYLGLLIFVAIIRFIEYKQTREAGNRINIIAKTTNRKLRLLIAMRKSSDSLQLLAFQDFFNPDSNGIKETGRLIKQGVIFIEGNLAAYNKLVGTAKEKIIFDSLWEFNTRNNIMNDSLLLLKFTARPEYQEVHSFIARKKNIFEDFHNTNHQLSDLVSAESEKRINDINQYMLRLAKRKEISSYVIIFLLFTLALTIGNTLKKIRKTENKYRLLFDLSPLPIYFVDADSLKILEVNHAGINKYGYSKEEFLRMTIFELRHAREREVLKKITDAYSGEGNIFEGTIVHYKKNGDAMHVELASHTIVLENKKAFLVTINDVTEKENQEREMAKAIIETQEDERRSLGAELHDNLGQILVSSHLFLDMAVQSENGSKEKYLAEAKKYLTTAIKEIRDISHRVAPAFIEQVSLPEAISQLLDDMNPDNKFDILFEYDRRISSAPISPDIKLNIYRILQEQLKNILKYSKATKIKVELSTKNGRIQMTIADNGIGFELNKVKPGIGLMNMRKRAELFSGIFIIAAAPQKGCTITVEIPFSTIKVA